MNDTMYLVDELKGKNYFTCAACMSVLADTLSWANKHKNKVTKDPEKADNIVVLSCQVTDLAVLNDIRTLERLKAKYPGKNFFVSGCLAQRKDIELPVWVKRLEQPRETYQDIVDKTLVNYEKPFWVKDFKEKDKNTKEGHLFRESYPLRIGKGCKFNCTYCTIRVTRGPFEELKSYGKLKEEFLRHDAVLLIADSPTAEQIKEWCKIALEAQKPISIRNVEPFVATQCKNELMYISKKKLLKEFHCPVQSFDREVLEDMHRHVDSTFEVVKMAKKMKEYGTFIATNIIINYKNFKQDFSQIYKTYDYVSWNPYWDRKWDRGAAEKRFEKYILNEPAIN